MSSDSNSSYGVFTAPGEVRFVRHLPGPIERAWTYLTDPEKRGKWLATGPMELWVGGRVELTFHHADLSPIPEKAPAKYADLPCGRPLRGRVTRCEPPRLLSYTWGDGPDDRSEVTFELTSLDREVRLVLTHSRLGDNLGTLANVAAGWHTHVAILIAHLQDAAPVPFWATHSKFEAEYALRLAELTAKP